MEKSKVRDFFDRYAVDWDADMVRDDAKIGFILDCAGVHEGVDVLDVACGTGVLFPDYFDRRVANLTAIDLSPEMTRIAKTKFPEADVICGDAEFFDFGEKYDAIVIYNAFPHFPSPEGIISALAGSLKPGGRLTVAHGMSRKALLAHHAGAASEVSLELPEAKALAELFSAYLKPVVIISDDEKYIVSGELK